MDITNNFLCFTTSFCPFFSLWPCVLFVLQSIFLSLFFLMSFFLLQPCVLSVLQSIFLSFSIFLQLYVLFFCHICASKHLFVLLFFLQLYVFFFCSFIGYGANLIEKKKKNIYINIYIKIQVKNTFQSLYFQVIFILVLTFIFIAFNFYLKKRFPFWFLPLHKKRRKLT